LKNHGYLVKHSICSQTYRDEKLLYGWSWLNISVAKAFADAVGFENAVAFKQV